MVQNKIDSLYYSDIDSLIIKMKETMNIHQWIRAGIKSEIKKAAPICIRTAFLFAYRLQAHLRFDFLHRNHFNGGCNQSRSKRSRFITLSQAAAKSFTNFSSASLDA
jgi:hypothetical protein